MDEISFAVTQEPEGGYSASAVGASIFAQADSFDALRAEVLEAVRCHFDER